MRRPIQPLQQSKVNEALIKMIANDMSVTCHYIQDFVLKSNLLDCFIITESHTAEHLAYKLDKVTQWEIKGKIAACANDNASNILKAVRELLKWNHVSCFLGPEQVSTCKVPVVFVLITFLSQIITFFTA